MRYAYGGEVFNREDRNNLRVSAENARDRLEGIEKQQKKLKKQIEAYEGEDWDKRYGVTGLWRELASDIWVTIFSKCEVEFYAALSTVGLEKKEMLEGLLAEVSSVGGGRSAEGRFLRAKILGVLGGSDSKYKRLAMEELNRLILEEAVPREIYFRAVVERVRVSGQVEPQRLELMRDEIARSKCKEDVELVLLLEFLQKRYAPEALEKTVELWPETEDFFGSLILSELSRTATKRGLRREVLNRTSVFEAELAALAAWKRGADNYRWVLECLTREKRFRRPLVLYVAALVEEKPVKAVEDLIDASSSGRLRGIEKLGVSTAKMAEQAARLAYKIFVEDGGHCEVVISAFDNYFAISEGRIDEELEYVYTKVLSECGQAARGKEVLERIANKAGSSWRNRAKLDLIIEEIRRSNYKGVEQRTKLLNELRRIIAANRGEDERQIREEATEAYCELLLESNDVSGAKEVLDILERGEAGAGAGASLLKSEALRQVGRLDEAVYCLSSSLDGNDCGGVGEATRVLSEFVERIDEERAKEGDFGRMMEKSQKLAEYCYGCAEGSEKYKAGLILAEILIVDGEKEPEQLSRAEGLLKIVGDGSSERGVDFLRCWARLLGAEGKFDKAAKVWRCICEAERAESVLSGRRSKRWWRAKFYELYCCAAGVKVKRKDVVHSIEVLESSFVDIPVFWAKKLSLLKGRCGSVAAGSVK